MKEKDIIFPIIFVTTQNEAVWNISISLAGSLLLFKLKINFKINAEGNKEYEPVAEISNIEPPTYPQYFVEMFSPETWEVIPNSRIEMDAHEHILCLKTVYLKSEASLRWENSPNFIFKV